MIHPPKQVVSVSWLAARPREVLFSRPVRLVVSQAFPARMVTRDAQATNFAKADNTIAFVLLGLAGIQS